MEITEMKAIPAAARAGGKAGVTGCALAKVLIKAAIDKAERDFKANESMKATLKRLEGFTREDHVSFRHEMQEKLDEQSAVAKALGTTLTDYRKADSRTDSVCVTVSLWKKMSVAMELGLKPNYDHSWAEISCQATEVRASQASPGTSAEAPKAVAPTKRKGRPSVSQLDKCIAAAELLLDNQAEFMKFAAWMQTTVNAMPKA